MSSIRTIKDYIISGTKKYGVIPGNAIIYYYHIPKSYNEKHSTLENVCSEVSYLYSKSVKVLNSITGDIITFIDGVKSKEREIIRQNDGLVYSDIILSVYISNYWSCDDASLILVMIHFIKCHYKSFLELDDETIKEKREKNVF